MKWHYVITWHLISILCTQTLLKRWDTIDTEITRKRFSKRSHFQHALCLLNILQFWNGVNAITFIKANQRVSFRSFSYIAFKIDISSWITLFQVTIDYKWISIIIYIEIKVILPFYAICIFYSVILWFKEVATFF